MLLCMLPSVATGLSVLRSTAVQSRSLETSHYWSQQLPHVAHNIHNAWLHFTKNVRLKEYTLQGSSLPQVWWDVEDSEWRTQQVDSVLSVNMLTQYLRTIPVTLTYLVRRKLPYFEWISYSFDLSLKQSQMYCWQPWEGSLVWVSYVPYDTLYFICCVRFGQVVQWSCMIHLCAYRWGKLPGSDLSNEV